MKKMKWEQVRQNYPNNWVVFEIMEANKDINQSDIAIIDTIYFFSTKRGKIEFKEKKWAGIRRI